MQPTTILPPIALLVASAALAACTAQEDLSGRELENANKSDNAGILLRLSSDEPQTMFVRCEQSGGCEVSLRASLRSPAYCDLFPEERSCGVACDGPLCEPLSKPVASVTVEDPSGRVQPAQIVVRSHNGRDFETVIEGASVSSPDEGLYFIDVQRVVEEELELLVEATWSSGGGPAVDAGPWTPDAAPRPRPDAAPWAPDASAPADAGWGVPDASPGTADAGSAPDAWP